MTSDDIIRVFNDLPTKAWPPQPAQQVIVNGDDWSGALVVRVSDLLHVMAWLIHEVEGRKPS